MERFDKFAAEHDAVPVSNGHTAPDADPESKKEPESMDDASPPTSEHKTGTKRPSHSDKEEELSEAPTPTPPKKKRKAEIDEDAAFAARLQAEENSRARPTRGGAARKPQPVKKKKSPKKKTSSKVNADDDSELDGGVSGTERTVNRNTGFHVRTSLAECSAP